MTVFHILAVPPVTVATTERANSALKHILTPTRSGMTRSQNRSSALILFYVHKDVDLDYELVIDEYANRFPRRMLCRRTDVVSRCLVM